MIKNYLIYTQNENDKIVIRDFTTGFTREISNDQLANCKKILTTQDEMFHFENFEELLKQSNLEDLNELVDDINPEDIFIKNDKQYIYLNGNRKLDWIQFRTKSGNVFERKNTFCIMYNRFNEKQYVFDQLSKGQIVYYDKMNQKFSTIELTVQLTQMIMMHHPLKAILNDHQGYLLVQYESFYADKIIIDPSQVKLFINGEQNMVGFFQIDINDQSIRDYREISTKTNEEIIKELQADVKKYFKYVAGIGTGIGLFQNNLIALETIVKQLQKMDKQEIPILICTLINQSPFDFSINHPKNVNEKYDELFGGKLLHSPESSDQIVSIEYNLINLPHSLRSNPQELMKVLSETERADYFENMVIQSIIKFKWNQYAKSFYQNRFYIYLIFMASFIFDIFYQTYASVKSNDGELPDQSKVEQDSEIQQLNMWLKISTKVICSIILAYFLGYELHQIRVQRRDYFKDGWNYFDFSHIIAFVVYCILDFTNENHDSVILIKILVIVLSFMKLFFFLRIYDGFSFLVQMMGGVFKDLKYFLIFFIIFILQFGMIFLVLFKAQSIDEYNGVNKLAYFLMAFRISSGDFQLEDYHSQNDGLVIFTWIIWLIAVMTLNIVFMNFIIAVISESYEKVMQKLVAESYRVKAHMIVEREQLFNEADLARTDYFPNFIVIRRPLNTQTNEAGEWQGFIKDLKYTIRTSAVKSKTEIIQNLSQLQTQNNSKLDQVIENSSKNLANEGLDEKISKLLKQQLDQAQENNNNDFKQLKTDVNGLGGQVKELKEDMELIKSSLSQLLQKFNQ
ncbi:wd-40 repeat protein [Stylonychia lemnae]|uniref:Wd-40 repeat protein n=1 Tax=Stylonychia lemnae TaxID=5949 RepID=A0A077ZQW4_STYLE|nr:wd-40 repeat protein [Stylonychia lemnae]|eukprot:CDW71819.1 wd-40 repeat protein [Stylonychia lemnae]